PDDFFQEIFDRDEAGRAAIFVDDDRDLGLLALELLEELGYALALGDDNRGAQERPHRSCIVRRVEADEILDENEPDGVVEALVENRDSRVLLLPEARAEFPDGRRLIQRNDVRPRRHDFADQRIAEIDDALEQAPLFSLNQPFLRSRLDVGLRRLV